MFLGNFHTTGVDIEFQQSEYTFSEKDGVGEVCLITSHGTTYDFSVTLRSELYLDHSAQGQPNLVYKMLMNLNYCFFGILCTQLELISTSLTGFQHWNLETALSA